MKRAKLCAAVAVLAVAVLPVLVQVRAMAQQGPTPAVDADDIGGIVTSASGPEAGVWVIAETRDLPTGFRKIVVTDDQGRYVVPDLPAANYNLWVRGYGLIDSARVAARPGRTVNLRATVAPSKQAAAQLYPANYWFSLLQVPAKSEFPIGEIRSQEDWIMGLKGLTQIMQKGDKATREIPEKLGRFQTSADAWRAWMKTPYGMGGNRTPRGVELFADWTDRIKAGELPPAPPRPTGVERNVVITQWDWSTDKGFLHDEIATDKRNPRLNANGPIYGLEQFSGDVVNVLDPVRNSVTRVNFPIFDENMTVDTGGGAGQKAPLAFGEEIVHAARANLHNPMLDDKGRLWVTGEVRVGDAQPAFCRAGSDHPSAKLFPMLKAASSSGGRQIAVYDPQTKTWTPVGTCYGTHHLQFAADANHTLFTSGDNNVVGFLNTKLFDETGDVVKAQNWCPLIVDTNGNGKPDAWTEPGDPLDPSKDMRVPGGGYGIMPNPVDGSVWMANLGNPGTLTRLTLGTNPPATCMAEVYNSPKGTFNPKGVDIGRDGVVWVSFNGSGHTASFDRRKCKVTNGPTATGNHCPEGWTVYANPPGPRFKGIAEDINTDYPYLNWVDQFNTFGLGENVPLMPGTNSDSIIALLPEKQQYVVFRVPYPLGFFARGLDGRIDDPNAGWKGRGLWSAFATTVPWNIEGGKGAGGSGGVTSKAVKFQLRPDPLAH